MNATTSMKTVGSMLLTMVVFVMALPVTAQEIETSTQHALNQHPKNYTVLHVNAAMGDDQQGSGSVERPYRTISQALRVAPLTTSTVILLAPGHYSQVSGEQFPLSLRPGITIQGDTGETRNTLIVGGGDVQDGNTIRSATIITSDRSGLANVAISNPEGSGVWITNGSPILRRVALVSNAIAGIQVTDSAPVIENSYFNRNQYGLTIQGNSRAVARGNYFEATGRAITIASPATPTIHNNRIARNDVGIALKNNARPVLKANVLNNNERNGVVEVEPTVISSLIIPEEASSVSLATSGADDTDDLGSARLSVHETSGTLAIAETRTDIAMKLPADVVEQSMAPEPISIPAALSEERIEEGVLSTIQPEVSVNDAEFESSAEPETVTQIHEASLVKVESGDVELGDLVGEISDFRQHLANSSHSAVTIEEQPPILQQRRRQSTHTSREIVPVTDYPLDDVMDDDAIPIAVIPATEPEAPLDVISNNVPRNIARDGVSNLLARLNQRSTTDPVMTAPVVAAPVVTTPAVTIPGPLNDNNAVSTAAHIVSSSQRLPVPSAAIPGSRRDLGDLAPPGAVSLTRTFRYRVLVDMEHAEDLQDLVPDAFRTRVGNRMFMQAGAYVDEVEAQERVEWLQQNGISGRVNFRN